MTMAHAYSPQNLRRPLAWLAFSILALSLLLSAAFVLVELRHDCTGEHCEICLAVAHSVSYLKAETASALPVSVSISVVFAESQLSYLQKHTPMLKDSPVTLKVKLSD